MAEKKYSDHVNLMTVDWGGNLSSELQCADNVLINHVKIFIWPNQEDANTKEDDNPHGFGSGAG
jgi:hypothetical protein